MCYILDYILKKYFNMKMKTYKYIKDKKCLPKYFNWLILLRNI